MVIHGHFYQPPREDPWTGRVPAQPDAAPDHDWNERITRECYRPLARAGAFEWLSFDVGPTLLRWLERDAPDVHEAIIAGDAASVGRLGQGNAIAQPYHHVILPLSTPGERATEVRSGLEDFRRRFGREASGMWLPETAVDRPTLQTLAEAGVAFTVLAPHQVTAPPEDGRAGRIDLDHGRSIAVFIYDGALSHGVAFGEFLSDASGWTDRLLEGLTPVRSIATDGETFGHHHEGADLTLMNVVANLRSDPRLRLENFASSLHRHGSGETLELVEPSSWSCVHGVERWRGDCGCKMDPDAESQQEWRAPLRSALRWLAGALPDLPELIPDRGAMFTSCAWFFDDIGGIEPTQVLAHAAHAIDLVSRVDPERAAGLERSFLERLSRAASNDPQIGTAAGLYRDRIRTKHPFGSPA